MTVDKQPNEIPLISVIICCYAGEKTIKACLNSLIHQDLNSSFFEVVIVDDGSCDNSSKIITEFINSRSISKHPNFKYFRKKNEGLSVARNFGLSKSLAEYVVYIDEDAIAFPDYLSVIVDYFDNNLNINCLGGEVHLYNKESKFARLIQDSIFSLYMKNENSIIGTNMAFRKSFLNNVGGFQPEFTYRGDETALFEKSKAVLVKGRTEKMKVIHFQPDNLRAWLKTRFENGFFRMALDFFIEKPAFKIYVSLMKSASFVSLPFLVVIAIFCFSSYQNISLIIGAFSVVLFFRKFLWNNVLKNTIKEFRRNRNNKTKILDECFIVSMIVVGEYKSNVGYLKGYFKFRNVTWQRS